MRHFSGWITRMDEAVEIDDVRHRALISAYCDLKWAALDAQRFGDVLAARRLAKSARQLVHGFGRRGSWSGGPVVGHA